jgi:hypothetical protein
MITLLLVVNSAAVARGMGASSFAPGHETRVRGTHRARGTRTRSSASRRHHVHVWHWHRVSSAVARSDIPRGNATLALPAPVRGTNSQGWPRRSICRNRRTRAVGIAAELQKRRQLNGADIIGLLGSPPPPTLPPSAPPSTLPSPSIPAEDQYSTRLHSPPEIRYRRDSGYLMPMNAWQSQAGRLFPDCDRGGASDPLANK